MYVSVVAASEATHRLQVRGDADELVARPLALRALSPALLLTNAALTVRCCRAALTLTSGLSLSPGPAPCHSGQRRYN